MNKPNKKLIEVGIPLSEINREASLEKSIKSGMPSILHLWWARRPIAASRAIIFSSLVDDPSCLTDEFPTKELQEKERNRLFKILIDLVKCENYVNLDVINSAKDEIMKSCKGHPPALLDPFAGGGAIPFAAQRLGLEAYAGDLNPVAVMINKAMIEIPPKFSGSPPINPDSITSVKNDENSSHSLSTAKMIGDTFQGSTGLAEDVKYYGNWMLEKATKKLEHLYPKMRDDSGKEYTVVAYIWARTVKCANPICYASTPLIGSFLLSKKYKAYVQPIIDGSSIKYEVKYGDNPPSSIKTGNATFKCLCCGRVLTSKHIHDEFCNKRSGSDLIAIVAQGAHGRRFFSPSDEQVAISKSAKPDWIPDYEMNTKCKDLVSGRGYGITHWSQLFTSRQLTALSTFSELIVEVKKEILKDGGSAEYAEAVSVYLSFVIDKLADRNSSFCSWQSDSVGHTFPRQAIAMVWDFAEANPLSDYSGSFSNFLKNVVSCLKNFLPTTKKGHANQWDAAKDNGLRNIMISTDPPYYDNISYADLSDFFYIWLKKAIGHQYPDMFSTTLVPKIEEITAMPYNFDGDRDKANSFFEDTMLKAFKLLYTYAREDIPTTVYYAYMQSETSKDGVSSTGWETMLSAIIKAGFIITGTWPMRTEDASRLNAIGTNALSTSIVIVCRKRTEDAPICKRNEFITLLQDELKPAIDELNKFNIAPVDMAQAVIGPGMRIYSRYSNVIEANGNTVSIKAALKLINNQLDNCSTENYSDFDTETRVCIDIYEQYHYDSFKFGELENLVTAKAITVQSLQDVVLAKNGEARLLKMNEVKEKSTAKIISNWQLMQLLTNALINESGIKGVTDILITEAGARAEYARDLANAVFQIAQRKDYTDDEINYNSLVEEWNTIQKELIKKQDSMKKVKPKRFDELE
ncbi:MAG: DUF1156 domain-containing protein [Christensenellaceae bacterium]|jgi:putative DNA methylase|nr:DUF1156 domain-containing protein [Christensenellaceae bacterium]